MKWREIDEKKLALKNGIKLSIRKSDEIFESNGKYNVTILVVEYPNNLQGSGVDVVVSCGGNECTYLSNTFWHGSNVFEIPLCSRWKKDYVKIDTSKFNDIK
eukprot:gene7869-12339_t